MPRSARSPTAAIRSAPSASPPSPPTCSRRSTRTRRRSSPPRSREAVGRGRPAPVAAAAAAEAVIALRADAEPLALFCADAALAKSPQLARRRCRYSPASCFCAAPRARDGGRARAKPAGSSSCAISYARAALAALDLAQDLSRRAGRLTDAAPKLRAKGKGRALEALLADDAVSAAAPIAGLSDRARRRLFDRLVAPRRRARAHRPRDLPPLRALNAMARKASPEPDFDRELADLPPELRWREWKARVEAVLFAAPKPVTREVLARVVGRDCALELLLDDLREDLRGRPIELVRAGEGFALHTRPAFGPAVRVAFDIPADAKQLTKLEAGVLMAVAMFQPVTRGEISEMFGREISRDLIAALREEGLIAAGPRSPKLGAPYAYVTTEKFLVEFGFELLRDLPDLEALKDAGLMGARGSAGGTGPCTRERRRRRQFAAAGRCARSRRVAGQPRQGWVEGSNPSATCQSDKAFRRSTGFGPSQPTTFWCWCPSFPARPTFGPHSRCSPASAAFRALRPCKCRETLTTRRIRDLVTLPAMVGFGGAEFWEARSSSGGRTQALHVYLDVALAADRRRPRPITSAPLSTSSRTRLGTGLRWTRESI